MTSTDCPTEKELAAFVIGLVSTPSLDRIERHVESCQRCQEALDALDVGSDVLLSQLTRTSGVRSADHDRAPELVLVSARTAIASISAGERREVSLDSGRHYARLLQDGPCRLGRFELLGARPRDCPWLGLRKTIFTSATRSTWRPPMSGSDLKCRATW